MNEIEKLTEYFSKFPGIGPRQAKRFVYFLLIQPEKYSNELSEMIKQTRKESSSCSMCFRFFIPEDQTKKCPICLNKNREDDKIMVVSKDVDVESIEKSGIYKGYYFVLGGTLRALEKTSINNIRGSQLTDRIKKEENLKEIILALPVHPDGDETARYITELIKSETKNKITVSTLGRGLSTGLEIEYSDKETIKNALENRKNKI